jgi:DNA replication protein DnaC
MSTVCPACAGTGWIIERRDGTEVAVRCSCRRRIGADAAARASRIPPRYRHCTVDGFEVWAPPPHDHLQAKAKRLTREFIDAYPGVDKGILFMGNVGTGKTHLAVAALAELATSKGVRGLYVNALDLVQQLQISFDGSGPGREAILKPITDAELLVLDELGAGRLTEWVRDLLYFVINSRYMGRGITICTTNYLDAPQPPLPRRATGGFVSTPRLVGGGEGESGERWQETLAERISERLRSRLFEMCDVVELYGQDYRARRFGFPGAGR